MEPIKITPHMLVTFIHIPFRGMEGEEARIHLSKFENLCEHYGIDRLNNEEVMMRCFRLTLKDKAREWEKSLPEGAKLSWKRFAWNFLSRFEIVPRKLEEERLARAKIERVEEVRMIEEKDDIVSTLNRILAKARQVTKELGEERREIESRRTKEINSITYNKNYSDSNNYDGHNNNKNREIEFKSTSYYKNPNLISESQSPKPNLTPIRETAPLKTLNSNSINTEAPLTAKLTKFMEEATNLFENSKNATKTLSAKIEKIATQVSRMEKKLLEEQQAEEEQEITKPQLRMDDGPAMAEMAGELAARQPDAPLLSADAAWEAAARIWYAPPESLPGSSPPRLSGWYNDDRWGCALYKKEIPCAGISLEKKDASSIAKKNEPEEEEDNGRAFVEEIRDMIRETARGDLENNLKNLPGVFSVNVQLDSEDKTLVNGVAVDVEILLEDEFGPIVEILLRDGKHDEQDIIKNLETITKFVEETKTGSRSIEEISQEWDFNNCIQVMKGERVNAGLWDPS